MKSQVWLKVGKERLKRFGYGEKEQDMRVPLGEKMIGLRMAYGLWRQDQMIEQETKVPSCEKTGRSDVLRTLLTANNVVRLVFV